MSSRPEFFAPIISPRVGRLDAIRDRAALWVAFSWGACVFFPVGLTYLNLVLLVVALSIAPDIRVRLRALAASPLAWPIALMVLWTVVVAVVGDRYPETLTRLFHVIRVALVLAVGMLLRAEQARAALAGFVTGASIAFLIVLAHHIWGMPDWSIWNSLLSSRNNFSSANMIAMAVAAGLCVLLGASRQRLGRYRGLLLALAVAFMAVVAFHGISRNAQMLLVALLLTVAMYRFRSLKAAAVALLAVLLLVALAWQFSPTTKERFVQMASDLRAVEVESNYVTSVGIRLRMYQVAAKGMVEHPILGTGLGSWLTLWGTAAAPIDAHPTPGVTKLMAGINNPHNDYLLAGMETGVPGMLILVWLVGGFVVLGWRKRGVGGGAMVVVGVAVAITTLFNAPFRDAAFGMSLLWLLGVSMALDGDETADA